jgi:hypothetical protein
VYATPVQGSKQQEPSGKLSLLGATLVDEGNENIYVNETLLIIDPDAYIGDLGSKLRSGIYSVTS